MKDKTHSNKNFRLNKHQLPKTYMMRNGMLMRKATSDWNGISNKIFQLPSGPNKCQLKCTNFLRYTSSWSYLYFLRLNMGRLIPYSKKIDIWYLIFHNSLSILWISILNFKSRKKFSIIKNKCTTFIPNLYIGVIFQNQISHALKILINFLHKDLLWN